MLSPVKREAGTAPAPGMASVESQDATPTLIEQWDAEIARLQPERRQIGKRIGQRADEMEALRARIVLPPPGTTPDEMAALQSRLGALAALVNADKAERERIELALKRAAKQREMLDSEVAFLRARRERLEFDVRAAEVRAHNLRSEIVIAERMHARRQAELQANAGRLAQIGAK